MRTLLLFLSITFALSACIRQSDSPVSQEKAPLANINSNELFSSIVPEANDSLPVLVFIDPQGNGEKPLYKYHTLAKENKCVLIGLNNVRNGQESFLNVINHDIAVAKKELGLKPTQKIFLVGFSGGGRMALYASMSQRVNGVLLCGAGPGNINIRLQKSPIAIITGTRDFNFSESYYPPESNLTWQEKEIYTTHFQGKHEWPPVNKIKEALNFLFSKSDLSLFSNSDYIRYIDENKDSLSTLEIYKLIELGFKTMPIESVKKYSVKLRGFSYAEKQKTYFSELKNELIREKQRNNILHKSIVDKDINWWRKELLEINNNIHTASNSFLSDSYSRTKSWMGVILFSKSQKAVRTKQPEKVISKILEIYELFEPQNPDVYYFKALYAFNTNKSYKKQLKKALKLGFNDYKRLSADFGTSVASKFLKP